MAGTYRLMQGKVKAMDEAGGSGLPAILEAAWGVRPRSGKRRQPALSLESVVEAAVRVAASEGLAAVSMNRVATELDASAMSLYRYVAGKDELLVLMADTAYRTSPSPREPGDAWRDGLSRWAWDLHRMLRQHTWVLKIPISGPPATPRMVAWVEHGLSCLADTGLAETEKLSVMMLLNGFVRSEATVFADFSESYTQAGATSQEAMSFYSSLLGKLADPERFPAFHAALSAGGYDVEGGEHDEFVFGLDRILDGIEKLIESRS
ncbi:TetR/AcrR family transcriptional regulator [Streptosporangium sp. DT93]|uniref:TetR/AcrR family transcriptional regulator n=1 Tax=Streptosporangium sp. DT93 TaxID=3393428 RepID=UPI003CF808E0